MPSVMVVGDNSKLQTLLVGMLDSTAYDALEVSPSVSPAHLQMTAPKPEAIIIGSDTQSSTDLVDTLQRFRQAFPT